MRDDCSTIAAALVSITSLDELDGFGRALADPKLKTKIPTDEDRRAYALKKIELQGNGK